MSETTTTRTASIAASASLSGEVDLTGWELIAIYMPADWTAANLTFSASPTSGGTFHNVYDSAGNELTVTAAEDRTIVDIPELAPLQFIKVRSGTSGTPVNQDAARTVTFILKKFND